MINMGKWESPGGGEVVVALTGLYIDGEFLEDAPVVPEETTPEDVPYAGSENESN